MQQWVNKIDRKKSIDSIQYFPKSVTNFKFILETRPAVYLFLPQAFCTSFRDLMEEFQENTLNPFLHYFTYILQERFTLFHVYFFQLSVEEPEATLMFTDHRSTFSLHSFCHIHPFSRPRLSSNLLRTMVQRCFEI